MRETRKIGGLEFGDGFWSSETVFAFANGDVALLGWSTKGYKAHISIAVPVIHLIIMISSDSFGRTYAPIRVESIHKLRPIEARVNQH